MTTPTVSSNKIGVSLWLEPSPSSFINGSLQSTITSLKPLFEDAPSFKPHVTITSQIDIDPNSQEQINAVLSGAKAAASSVDRIDIVLSKLTYGSKFFKKVYISVEPSLELLSLARVCREEFVILPSLLRSKRRSSSSSSTSADHNTTDAQHGRKSSVGSNNSASSTGNTSSNTPAPKSPSSPQSSKATNSAPTQVLSPPLSPSSPEYKLVLSEAAKEAASWTQNEFDPHLSLVYSSTYPIEEATKTTIDSRLSDVFGDNFMKKKVGFSGARLTLVYCEGPVEKWKVLGYRDF